jgi:hypothetical protein
MGCRVDAPRSARDDDDAGAGDVARQHRRRVHAVGRRAARADDGDGGPREQTDVAAHVERERRVRDLAEVWRVGIVRERDHEIAQFRDARSHFDC